MPKLKVYVHTTVRDPGEEFHVFATEMREYGYIPIDTIEFDYTPPSREVLIPAAVEALRTKQDDVRAKSESDIRTLEEQIQSLLSITHEQA